MIKTIAFALFGLALASAAQAMPFFASLSARRHDYASSYGLWRGQGNGQRCLPVQSRHAPGAPSQPQVCTIFRRRLRSVSLTAAAAALAAWQY